MQRKLWLLLSAFILVLSASAQAALLIDPEPIAVPAGLNNQQVATEIKRALASRGWVVTKEQAGRIDASLSLRAHVARIVIDHDKTQIRVAYVSSENLKYSEKNGKRTIHKNYLSWINNLTSDIYRNLQSELH